MNYAQNVPGGGILAIVFFVTSKLYYQISIKRGIRFYIQVALSAFYAVILNFGIQLDLLSTIQLNGITLLSLLFLMIEIFPFIVCMMEYFDKKKIVGKEDKKSLRNCFVIILFAWIMAYLALFPGVYATDAPYWYHEFLRKDIPISSQWSPVYCGIFYLFVNSGKLFFDNYSIGFAVFTLLQMSISLYVIWNILSFINDKTNKTLVILSTLFFLLPMHVILSLTSAQDSIFTASFAMVVLLLIEYLLDEQFLDKKNTIKLFLWMFLMCVIRNNGVYVLAFVLLTALLLKARRKLLMLLTSVIILVAVYQEPVYALCGVQKGTALREMLSLPLQQMAWVYNNDDLTEKQRKEMQSFVPDEGWKNYTPFISDPVKSNLKVEEVQRDKISFLKSYIKFAAFDSIGYVQAFGLQTLTLWYPDKNWPDARPWHPYIDILCYDKSVAYDPGFEINRESLFPSYQLLLENLYGKGIPGNGYGGSLKMIFSKIPIFSILCQAGFYSCLLLFLGVYTLLINRNKKIILLLSMIFGIWLTVLLSPVIMYRYCAPFIFTAPLYISSMFLLKEETRSK